MSGRRKVMVEIVSMPEQPLMVGVKAQVVSWDWIPGTASEDDPLCTLRLPNREEIHVRLSQCRLARDQGGY